MQQGDVVNGFKLIEEKYIADVGSVCRIFEHIKTGAKLVNLANDDDNKVFSITFKTPPEDDTGKAHVLEHGVFSGSAKFPVKDITAELNKSFISKDWNAHTLKLFTLFHYASKNEKEYKNMMEIYLDMVFNPNIYTNEMSFQIEGWHYELENKDSELKYNGVVYNEMKGGLSEPYHNESDLINRTIFPDTNCRFNCGGIPNTITALTYEDMLAYHCKYYHPSNSYIYLYGDMNVEEYLKLINDNIKEFDKSEIKSDVSNQEKIYGLREYNYKYSIGQNEEEKNNYKFLLNYLGEDIIDQETEAGLILLTGILTAENSIRELLMNKKIARDVKIEYKNESGQSVLIIGAEGANIKKKDKFVRILRQQLKGIVNRGIDKDFIEGTINKNEFLMREMNSGDQPRGLELLDIFGKAWFRGGNPIDALEYEKHIENIKRKADDGYFENLIRKYILDNKHSTLIILEPEKGLTEKNILDEKKKMKEIKDSMSKEEIEKIVDNTKKLRAEAIRKDSPEVTKCIPRISKEDIGTEVNWIEPKESEIDGVKIRHYEKDTNKLMYIDFEFDSKTVPEKLIPYVSLLVQVLFELDTEEFSNRELLSMEDKNVGDMSIDKRLLMKYDKKDSYEQQVVLKVRGLASKTKIMLEILEERMQHALFTDYKDLHTLISEHRTSLKNNIEANGEDYAMTLVESMLTKIDKQSEIETGLEFYNFISELDDNFWKNKYSISENLETVRDIIINKKFMSIMVVCDGEDYKIFEESVKKILPKIEYKDFEKNEYDFIENKSNIGIKTESNLQYVVLGSNFIKAGYEYSAKMQVLSSILDGYLHDEVRLKGGAYTTSSIIEEDGNVLFSSYRDPNISETFEAYFGILDYIENLDISQEELNRYIVGATSTYDMACSSPYEEAATMQELILSGATKEMLEKRKGEVLSTTLDDVRGNLLMLGEVLFNGAACVIGNGAKIEENDDLFHEIREIL